MPRGAEVDVEMKVKWSAGVRREVRTQFTERNVTGMNAPTASAGDKIRLPFFPATTTGWWGILVVRNVGKQEITFTPFVHWPA